ncbi:MAG TPA: endonuclease/exonuclease/phosphatase family protein [Bacteroidales bacterium]
MKKAIKISFWSLLVLAIIFGGIIAFFIATDFRPAPIISLMEESHQTADTIKQDTLVLMSWNIGYAGLGKEMDFFYDGGKKVRPSKEMARKYLDGIKSFVQSQDSVDFILLQEIDLKAKRSYKMNEVKEMAEAAGKRSLFFAINYSVPFVPVPITQPMGYVEGGMVSFSDFFPSEATRFAYPLIAPRPDRLFLLDRCFILTRFPLKNGRDLVVINTHNSAFVSDSLLMAEEFEILKVKMLEEYAVGNYVIAGGDWNANPPNFLPEGDYNGNKFAVCDIRMNEKTMPATWVWAVDASVPTNRYNDKAFVKGENRTTTLDYFLVSPNLGIIFTQTVDLGFEDSDHNPVFIKIFLKEN